ncbi:peptidoglycan-binding protein [Streptomyces sp. NPDC088190]|uniref:peptidoglycan-binding domain-containing protein n=1 Tax=unclassified Streptomyces TaxID=2593676 RepID=UPI0038260D0F
MAKGMVGSKVRQIQCLLNSNYDYTLTVDGEFGESTDVAVRAIQSCSGLKPDGQVGPQTWKYLDTPCPAAGIEASDPVPAVPPASGRHGFFAWCEGMVVLRARGRLSRIRRPVEVWALPGRPTANSGSLPGVTSGSVRSSPRGAPVRA